MRLRTFRTQRGPRGFTLVELVCVIVLLAVLAAMALPRLPSLGTDGRLATVKQLAAALRTAAHNANAVCLVKIDCGHTVYGSAKVTAPDGAVAYLYNGYPSANALATLSHISHWVNINGTTMDASDPLVTVFSIPSSPDPAGCKVSYNYVPVYGGAPEITLSTNGC